MKRFWGHVLAALGAIAATSVLSSGCVHDDSTLFIRDVLQPPISQMGSICLYTADPTQPVISFGLMDVAFSSTYSPTMLIGNQLVPRGDQQQVRTETNRITIQGFVISINDSNGSQLASFTRLAAATIDPGTGDAPGYAPVTAEIIDANTGAMMASQLSTAGGEKRLVVFITAFGQTLGGQKVESNKFQFPVDVCYGCLVTFPPDSNNTQIEAITGKPNCLNSGSMGTIVQPCVLGQDQSVDCRLCVGTLGPDNPACIPPGGSNMNVGDASTGG